MTYWRTFYHLVWSTKNREPMLTAERMHMLQQAFRVVAKDKGVFTHAVGGMPDHIHVAVSIPPSIAVSEYVQLLKGSSSRYFSKQIAEPGIDAFAWQGHYGVLTFGERSLERIVRHIENQAVHHANDEIWQALELIPPAGSAGSQETPRIPQRRNAGLIHPSIQPRNVPSTSGKGAKAVAARDQPEKVY